MGQVISNIPAGGLLNTNKPTGGMFNSITEGKVYLENKTILKGQSMGLLLSLTYPERFSFIGERT
jgi:hypothetical protein